VIDGQKWRETVGEYVPGQLEPKEGACDSFPTGRGHALHGFQWKHFNKNSTFGRDGTFRDTRTLTLNSETKLNRSFWWIRLWFKYDEIKISMSSPVTPILTISWVLENSSGCLGSIPSWGSIRGWMTFQRTDAQGSFEKCDMRTNSNPFFSIASGSCQSNQEAVRP